MRITAGLALVAAAAASGCGGADPVAAAPTATAQTRPLSLVAIGDSIAIPMCGGCESFVDLWGHRVSRDLRRPVTVVTDSRPEAEATDTLKLVTTDAATRADLEAADLIVVQIGFNDTPWNRKDDPCRAAPRYPVIKWRKITAPCIDRVARQYERMLDAILTEVSRLRAGKPTAVRVTTLYNAVIGNHVDPSWDSPAAVAPSKAAIARFAQLQFRLATKHHGTCVAVHRAFNGADGSKPAGGLLAADYTHPSARGHELIARLLTQAGTDPLQ
jgi:lysophospholipase L1-like esterase